MILGIISDTHGLLRPAALLAMRGANIIMHAGDIGDPQILPQLKKLAPVVAIRGNIDTAEWAKDLPVTATANAGKTKIFVLHDVHALEMQPATAGFSIVVSGHSHNPAERIHKGVLYINPGSAGPRRFKLPSTVARIDLSCSPWKVEFIDVSGNDPRPVDLK
jgi:putative phosphoesterase